MGTLRRDSIEHQLLPLLSLFRKKYSTGMSLKLALREATREIAADHQTTYETIADACTRRLGLTGPGALDRFRELLRKWVDGGDPSPLAAIIKMHSDVSSHSTVDAVIFGQKKKE